MRLTNTVIESWREIEYCPFCGSDNLYSDEEGRKNDDIECEECGKSFSVLIPNNN